MVLLFITACTPPKTDTTPTLSPEEREKLALKEAMLDQSSYLYDGSKILRFYKGRFAIYEDAFSVPVSYGKVELEDDEIIFISKSRRIRNYVDINKTALKLWTKTKENILIKELKERRFYRPKNLFDAIKFGTYEEVKRLVEAGASVNEPDALGALPLSEAIYHGRDRLVPFLIEQKADIFAQTANGYTPLHVAVEAKSMPMVRLLFEHGAKSQLKACESFLEILQKDESFGMSRLLIESGLNPSCDNSRLLFWVLSSELLAKKNQTLAALDYLLAHHIKVDVVSDELGDTPLMRAAAVGNETLVERLIKHGIDIHAKDRFGRTALDYDSLYLTKRNEKVAAILRKAGLNSGIKAESDALYKQTQELLASHQYQKAYESFKSLSQKYKQKRFYQGKVDALKSIRNPTIEMIKELIESFAYLNHDMSEFFYISMIDFYKKMAPLSHKKEDLDANGNFKEGSVWYVYDKIDRLYIALYEKYPKIDYLYERWRNYKKFKGLRRLKRRDIRNHKGMRYVGETLEGIPFGKGSLRFADGSKYVGHVFNFVRHGKGRMTYNNGQIYDGQWVEDQREGKAFFTDERNAMYLGTFKNDEQTGDKKLVRAGR
jgi:ankyrin repeat protein